MFFSQRKKATKGAIDGVRPLVALAYHAGGIPLDFWRFPYVLGYMTMMISHHAKLSTRGNLSTIDLGFVSADVFTAISNINGAELSRLATALSMSGDEEFSAGLDDAAALCFYQLRCLRDESSHPLVMRASSLASRVSPDEFASPDERTRGQVLCFSCHFWSEWPRLRTSPWLNWIVALTDSRTVYSLSVRLTWAASLGGLLVWTAACNEGPDSSKEPTPAEIVAADTPVSDAVAQTPVVLTAVDLRRVCKAGLAAIHGQTAEAIAIDGLEGEVVNASWPAPVDGGRMRVQCRVDGDLVTWKPLDRPSPEQNRWMNQSGDPVVRFVLDGDTVTINQTLADGTTASEDPVVIEAEEAG